MYPNTSFSLDDIFQGDIAAKCLFQVKIIAISAGHTRL